MFTSLKRCDAFPADYKDDYLRKIRKYNRKRKIAIMALIGMMKTCEYPPKDINAKGRKNSDNCRGDKKRFFVEESLTRQNNSDKKKKKKNK